MEQKNNPAKTLGAVSFALSLLGLGCIILIVTTRVSELCFSVGCIVFSVPALVLGITSRKRQNRGNPLALTGFITAIVTLALFIMLWTLIIALFFFFSDVISWFSGLGKIG